MGFQPGNSSDSSSFLYDTVNSGSGKPDPVFLSEDSSASSDFPVSSDINRNLTPDWVLYFLIAFLVALAWIRLIYTKFIVNIFKSTFNFQLAVKVFNEPGIIQKRIFTILNVFYYLSTAIFLYVISKFYGYHPLGLDGIQYMAAITAFLIAYSLFRVSIMKITGEIFYRQKLFSEAIFHNFLFNKVTGIVIVPFILLAAYTRGIYQEISVISGIVALIAINIARILRGIVFVSRYVVLLFYFILYLCTLEILPVLVIIKLIFSLSKGS
jgi:hypothetical protein